MLLTDIVYAPLLSGALRAESKRAHQIATHYGPRFQPNQRAACLRFILHRQNMSFLDLNRCGRFISVCSQIIILNDFLRSACADRLPLSCCVKFQYGRVDTVEFGRGGKKQLV